MNVLRSLVPALVAAVFTLAAAPAQADGPDGGGHMQEMAAKLGLNDTQKAQIDDILYKSKSAGIAIHARKEAAELDLHHAMMAATEDDKAIGKALDALNAANADENKNRVDMVLAMRKVLTPAQWTQASAMFAEDHEEGRGEHEGRGGGHDDGDDDDDSDRGPSGHGDMPHPH